MSASGWRFWLADVFGFGAYTGNQLAVLLDDAGLLSSDHMQAIARETNLAETGALRASV